MTTQQERLAEALAIQQLRGDQGGLWIATRIGSLAAAVDAAGVERFLAIAVEYEKLLSASVQ